MKILVSIFVALFFISFVSATQYSNCEIYGTCKAVRQSSITNINQTINNITVINGSSYNASYVPYTGATSNVDLNSYNFTANRIKLTGYSSGSLASIFADNDENTGIHFDGPDIFSIFNGGTRTMTLSSSNFVGIGTQAPAYRLDVNGTINSAGYLVNGTFLQTPTNITATYVPYVGAVSNVDLGTRNISANTLFMNGSILSRGNFSSLGNGSVVVGYINNAGSVGSTGQATLLHGSVIMPFNLSNVTGIVSSGSTQGDFIRGLVRVAGSTGNNSRYSISTSGGLNGATLIGTISSSNGGGSNNSLELINNGGNSVLFGGVAGGTSTRNNQILSISNLNSGIGSFVQGFIQGGTNARSSMTNSGAGAFVRGYTISGAGVNTTISNTGDGSFVHGFIATNCLNACNITSTAIGTTVFGYIDPIGGSGSIGASGQGAFIKGHLITPNSSMTASGTGSVAIGLPNMTVSGTGSIGLGQNVNVSGNNAMAIGLGSNTMQQITSSNMLAIMTGKVGINSTNPNYLFEIGNQAKALNVSNFLFVNGSTVGIGTDAPAYPLVVNTNISGISIWTNGNISSAGYITRTEVYDKTKGNATDLIKDASFYKTANGSINHSAFGWSYTQYKNKRVVGYQNVIEYKEYCNIEEKTVLVEKVDEETGEVVKDKFGTIQYESQKQPENVCKLYPVQVTQPVYQEYMEQGVDLVKLIATQQQAIYELTERVKYLENEVKILKDVKV